MTNNDRDQRPASGILVHPLADSVYTDAGATGFDRYALAVNSITGETYLLHTEGVMYRVSQDRPWRFNDYSVTSPFYTLLQVRQFATTAPVDLAHYIRQFGARLESNYFMALGALTRDSCSKDTTTVEAEAYRMVQEIVAKANDND